MATIDVQTAMTDYQAATAVTAAKRAAWEDAKNAETLARLEMNTATAEEEAAAEQLLAAVQQPGLVIMNAPSAGLPAFPPPPPAPAEPPATTLPVNPGTI